MSTYILWEPEGGAGPSGNIGQTFIVELDACMSQSHDQSNDVTQHPIELGGKVSDHAFKNPNELRLEGIISNTPLIYLASARMLGSYALQQYELLRDLMDKRYVATVLTSLWSYDSMILASLSSPRTAANGDSILVNLNFKRVEIVASATVAAPVPSMARGQPKKEMGSQGSTPVTAKLGIKASLLVQGYELMMGL